MQGLREHVNMSRDRDRTSDFNNFCQSAWMPGGPGREKPFYQHMMSTLVDAYAEKQKGKG
jgi:hypothetical protein